VHPSAQGPNLWVPTLCRGPPRDAPPCRVPSTALCLEILWTGLRVVVIMCRE
jgi:hypothetical protein